MTRGDEVDNDCDGAVDEENCDGTGTDGEGIPFFVCCHTSNSRIVCFYGDVVIIDVVLQNLGRDLYCATPVVTQGPRFLRPHL